MKKESIRTVPIDSIADPKESVFRQVLEQFYGGEEDQGTIRILRSQGEQI